MKSLFFASNQIKRFHMKYTMIRRSRIIFPTYESTLPPNNKTGTYNIWGFAGFIAFCMIAGLIYFCCMKQKKEPVIQTPITD